jgi:hypothetical protein
MDSTKDKVKDKIDQGADKAKDATDTELLISVCDSNALRMCQEKEMVRNFGTCRQ